MIPHAKVWTIVDLTSACKASVYDPLPITIYSDDDWEEGSPLFEDREVYREDHAFYAWLVLSPTMTSAECETFRHSVLGLSSRERRIANLYPRFPIVGWA